MCGRGLKAAKKCGCRGLLGRVINVSCPPSPRLNISEEGYDRRLGYKQNLSHRIPPTFPSCNWDHSSVT